MSQIGRLPRRWASLTIRSIVMLDDIVQSAPRTPRKSMRQPDEIRHQG